MSNGSKPTSVQESFFLRIQAYLFAHGIDYAVSEFLAGRDGGSYRVTADDLVIYVYEDGSAEIMSARKVDRFLKVIPKKIAWRYEAAQYTPQSKLESEFFMGLHQALEMNK